MASGRQPKVLTSRAANPVLTDRPGAGGVRAAGDVLRVTGLNDWLLVNNDDGGKLNWVDAPRKLPLVITIKFVLDPSELLGSERKSYRRNACPDSSGEYWPL